MTELELCEELLDADICRVDFIPRSGTVIPVPFAVPNIAELKGSWPNPSPLPSGWCSFAQPMLSLHRQPGSDIDATISSAQHKVNPSRKAMGIVKSHQTVVEIERGVMDVKRKLNTLENTEFHVLITTYAGRQYLAYSGPNSPKFALSEADSDTHKWQITAELESMSSTILLTTE